MTNGTTQHARRGAPGRPTAKGIFLIVVGLFVFAAAVVGLIHPQWQGSDKKVDVAYGTQHYVVTTRRIIDIPVGFCISIMIAGGCTAVLGAITRAKSRNPE